ncbi:hypothetical protein FGG08_000476 [Glutinoglossum americanum]|uniref:Uncharacterized protein n=1 Tax=Glutinoglossum americanum TaxID=1670608 RepID=A0A9P8L604_9PEZI|nr:hypothetical protein FGG08_000476 [Glutinoglossum americanum]
MRGSAGISAKAVLMAALTGAYPTPKPSHESWNYALTNSNFSGNYCPGGDTIQCCVEPKTTPTDNECSDPKPNTCSFYPNCLESRFQCGSSGYPLSYGLNYCDKFTAARSSMSPSGQQWVTATMLCLQRALVIYGDGSQSTTCPALREYAFATHPGCYVQSGVCALPPSDWEDIISTVSFGELFSSFDALKATLKTVGGCVEFYLWLVEREVLGAVGLFGRNGVS